MHDGESGDRRRDGAPHQRLADRSAPTDRSDRLDTDQTAGQAPARALESTAPFSGGARPEEGIETQVGRYAVRRLVGLGGMGLVVAAHDPDLGRMVAIKLVTTESEEGRARLVREAQAMARLSHPNVVTVHEVVRIGDRAGIVMELVEGEDLAVWCAAAPRSWREIVAAYVQAARGLAAAHRAGLVHRDFKPSNALIDRDGVVRVTDFGLVRAAGPTEPGPPPVSGVELAVDSGALLLTLTRTGAVMGTPAYMAPEQHAGEAVDARTDQWALGCSLYEALHGLRPFAGTTAAEISAAVRDGLVRPEPTDTRVPRPIRAALRRALALRPADRFATMDELIAALSPARRRWQIAAAVGLVAAAGAIAAAVVLSGGDAATCTGLEAPLVAVWNPSRAAALRSRFAAGAGSSSDATERAIASLDRYGAGWEAARRQACTLARQGVQSQGLLDRRMGCLDQRLVEMSEVVGSLVQADPATVRVAGQAVDQLHPTSDCDDPRETVPRPAGAASRRAIDDAETVLSRGWAFQALGQYERALPLAREAAAAGERTGWSPLLARALILQGECEDRMQTDYAAALATFDRAATVAARARDDVAVVEALAHRFLVLGEHMGRRTEALAARKLIEVALERAGHPPRLQAEWLHFLAIMLLALERNDEALAAEVEAVAIWRRIVPAGHVYLVDSLETEGNIEIMRGQFDRADMLLREVLMARIAAGGPDHPRVADTLTNLGNLETARGQHLAAAEDLERAVAIARAADVGRCVTTASLGLARFDLGQWRAAARDLETALARAEIEAPGASMQVCMAATGLAAALTALGELDRAAALIERGIEAGRDSGSPQVVDSLAHAARVAVLRGDRASARARLDEARKLATSGTHSPLALAGAELARAETGCRGALPAYELAVAAAGQDGAAWVKTAATAGLAECLIQLRRPAEAVAALEPHIEWLERAQADPAAAAPMRFALARALAATGGDGGRARSLADAARAGFATLGEPGQARADAVTRWLGHHPR